MFPCSSRSIASLSTSGMYCWRQRRSCWPTPSFLAQVSSSCSKVPTSVHPCILQIADWVVPILCSLAWVLSRFSIMRQRKLASSGGTPGCLQAFQDRDQSVVGLASSALHGISSLELLPVGGSIIMKSSVRSLVQSFSLIFYFI